MRILKVLLTGCAGFLGQNLSRAFLKKGWEVHGIDDLSVGNKDWLPSEVIFDRRNICDNLGDLGYYDLVIHLASKKIPREGNSHVVLHENTKGLTNILQQALLYDSKFIYLSTSDVYGMNKTFTEDSNCIIGQPDINRWSYAVSKMWCEQLLYSTPEHFNFNIVRLFGTYGPYHALSWTAGPQSVFISQALKKEPTTIHGHGQQQRAFQYVDDAVDGIIKLVESDYKREIFNIGNPDHPVSIYYLARLIWGFVNGADVQWKQKSVEPSVFKYEEIPSRIPDITKARKLLGFEPQIGLVEGLAKTIEWQRGVV